MSIYRESNTRAPMNINDTDIDPAMKQAPVPRQGLSEMSFSLMRCVLCCAFIDRFDVASLRLPQMRSRFDPTKSACYLESPAIDKLYDHVRAEYLDLFDQEPTSSICRLGSEAGRVVFIKLRLQASLNAINQPGFSTTNAYTDTDRKNMVDGLFENAIEILECAHRFYTDPVLGPFSWIGESHVQWHAAVFVV